MEHSKLAHQSEIPSNDAQPDYPIEEHFIVKKLREVTHSTSPRQVEMMGSLADDPEVTPEKFERWFNRFADGMNYVYQQHGEINNNVSIVDTVTVRGEKRNRILGYIPESDTIAVSRGFLKDSIDMFDKPDRAWSTAHTPGQFFDPSETVTLLGVEEACHANQLKRSAEKYQGQDYVPVGMNGLSQEDVYSTDIEKDTSVVVQNAIDHFGFKPRSGIALQQRVIGID